MKYFLVAILCLFLVQEGIAKCCDGPEDCGPGECCTWKGDFGWCEKFSEKGEECSSWGLSSGLYPNRCPCVEGFECKPTNEFYYKGMVTPTDYKCVN
ncbi:hypothetical protein AVEN_117475-1 [Araneus ventricosus]|uniref:Prokineticin domain-containing protein n=1 Tax=Araneus ventricosus TaxID=182803 RepID=A0A4Y2HUG6_ARAVE|nr:hypothetical protein AVEN_117475-1 [Araneus ventricosus]